jgi:hypothetical protein
MMLKLKYVGTKDSEVWLSYFGLTPVSNGDEVVVDETQGGALLASGEFEVVHILEDHDREENEKAEKAAAAASEEAQAKAEKAEAKEAKAEAKVEDDHDTGVVAEKQGGSPVKHPKK